MADFCWGLNSEGIKQVICHDASYLTTLKDGPSGEPVNRSLTER